MTAWHLRGDHAELAGCIAMKQGRLQTAAGLFDKEAAFRRKASQYALMAEALARGGLAHGQSGEPEKAANRFLRAGRSAQLQGMAEEAVKWLTRAAENAGIAGNDAILKEVNRRLSEIRSAGVRRLNMEKR